MTTPFQEVGAGWVDGERGRYLRSLWIPTEYEEVIATDLMRITAGIQARLARWGLRLAVTGDALFQALVDFVQLQIESPYRSVRGPRRKVVRPSGWTEDDDRIWIEWLETSVLAPDAWTRICGEEMSIWEESIPQWRREWLSYLPYFVARSRDILQEIDPRPWVEEENGVPVAHGDEEWRR